MWSIANVTGSMCKAVDQFGDINVGLIVMRRKHEATLKAA
jgi:hypothetical protein